MRITSLWISFFKSQSCLKMDRICTDLGSVSFSNLGRFSGLLLGLWTGPTTLCFDLESVYKNALRRHSRHQTPVSSHAQNPLLSNSKGGALCDMKTVRAFRLASSTREHRSELQSFNSTTGILNMGFSTALGRRKPCCCCVQIDRCSSLLGRFFKRETLFERKIARNFTYGNIR